MALHTCSWRQPAVLQRAQPAQMQHGLVPAAPALLQLGSRRLLPARQSSLHPLMLHCTLAWGPTFLHMLQQKHPSRTEARPGRRQVGSTGLGMMCLRHAGRAAAVQRWLSVLHVWCSLLCSPLQAAAGARLLEVVNLLRKRPSLKTNGLL